MDSKLKDFLKAELEGKFGDVINITEENNVLVVKNASRPDSPINKDYLNEIITSAHSQKEFKLGEKDLAYTIDDNGTIFLAKSTD